jgi:hypothetical protein
MSKIENGKVLSKEKKKLSLFIFLIFKVAYVPFENPEAGLGDSTDEVSFK